MDPNVISDQREFAEGKGRAPENDGASFLRRLKETSDTDPAPTISATPDPMPAPAPAPAFKERRRSPRFQCTGSVEFQVQDSDVRLWGNLSDISLHGCYVEMPTTFPLDTVVTLKIQSLGIHVTARATVRVCYPFLGMGMCFSEIDPGQQLQLEQLLHALAGQRAIINSAPVQQDGPPVLLASADAWACLQAVTEFFRENTSLSRDEFYAIAKRVCRS